MKPKEFTAKYRAMSEAALAKEIAAKKEKLSSLIFDATRGKVKNVREAKILHRDLARLKTFLVEKGMS